jgi:hypothetical protein
LLSNKFLPISLLFGCHNDALLKKYSMRNSENYWSVGLIGRSRTTAIVFILTWAIVARTLLK